MWDFLLLRFSYVFITQLTWWVWVWWRCFQVHSSHWWGGMRPLPPGHTTARLGIGSRPSPSPTDAALVGRPSSMGPVSGGSTDTSPKHTLAGMSIYTLNHKACLDRPTRCTWWSSAPPIPRPTLYTWCWRPTRLHLSSTTVDNCRGTIAGPRLPRRTCCRWPHCMSSAAAVG